ncbi:MAG: leucine-rich repeat domain-containing protein [Treponemataceae bacterium]|nr:leucine-rich repeat domain-containing protein [Treponemataceae bacterium]
MKRISKYAALFAVLVGMLVMGCDSGNGGGNEPSAPLTVTNGTVISCDRTTKGTVEIPSGVTAIGDYAFNGCTGLTEISIPSSVKSVGQNAFAGCYGLTVRYAGTKEQWEKLKVDTENVTVVCRDGTVGDPLTIEDGIVTGCDKTVHGVIEIPAGVTAIGDDAFRECEMLISVKIPNGVVSIGECAFYRCPLLTSVVIPDSVTSIGSHAFCQCECLTTVSIPYGVPSIGEYTFAYCRSLTDITIPNSVTSIGYDAFKDCDSLKTVHYDGTLAQWCDVGNDTDAIGESAESIVLSDGTDIKKLTELVIPDGVERIGKRAFSACSNLTSVSIPGSVMSIGESAFSVDTVHYHGTLTQWCEMDNDTGSVGAAKSIVLSDGTDIKKLTELVIPNDVKRIGKAVFCDCSNLTSVTIPGNVMSIGESAFEHSDYLRSVTILNGVTIIGDAAFSGCWDLTSVTIPDSVTSIGNLAFSRCSFETVIIPSSVTSIGKSAFSECQCLEAVDIPYGVTSIEDSTFSDCRNLTSVTIPSSVTSIGSGAFRRCDKLESVHFNITWQQWYKMKVDPVGTGLLEKKIIGNGESWWAR